jgi:hypothetical protein
VSSAEMQAKGVVGVVTLSAEQQYMFIFFIFFLFVLRHSYPTVGYLYLEII